MSISTQRKSTREYLLLVEDLPMDKSRLLFERANNAYRTHPIEIMLTALITTIPKYLTIADTLVELEFHGRSESDDINITRSVGWFTRIAVLETCEGKSTNDTLLHVKNKYRELLQQHSFTPLLHSQVAHHIIRFNYLGEFQGEYNHFKLEPQQRNNNEMTATIEIDLVLQNGKLRCQCRINDDLSYINAIEKFCDSYMEELSGTIDYCVQQEDIILTPSDFDMVELTNDELQQLFEE
ncbi:Gramicidin S synthase 1 [compost metagenome]